MGEPEEELEDWTIPGGGLGVGEEGGEREGGREGEGGGREGGRERRDREGERGRE